MGHIIAAIRQRLADPERVIDAGAADQNPPTTMAKVDAAEEALGFPIPAILRRLYTEVANGHFGPGYGLVGVDDCGTDERRNDIVALYRGQSSELGYANCLVPYGRGLNDWLLPWAKGENVEFPPSMSADAEPG